ncbi:restriction endonuclease subunit S [Phocaeicola vulgatus]|uniref:restriction endonuclease subunit S n=1 Tax=Phocaeicola vulgatus TaxID=821 RepID=UPI000C21D215|nr:restriction endonuclease subunit S [Phocaeicola vulgatus]
MADNNENKVLNVPHLRFPEFSGEWNKYTINDLATVVGGGTPDTTVKSYWGGDIQWFTPSEIGKNKYVDFSKRTITRDGLDNSSAKLLPLHTILLSSRATVGECSIASNECTTNQGFQSLIAKQCNIDFLYYLIQTKKKDLIRNACGSTFLEISANEIRKIKVAVPVQNEQEQIAKLLSLIDERIATQNKIIEKLQSLIKGLAVALTTKEKANIAISQCLECHSSTLQESEVLSSGLCKVFGANGLVGYKDVPQMNGDAILVIKDGSGVGTVSYAQGKFSVIGTLNYLTVIGNNDLRYLYFALSVFNFQPYKTGMAIPHIYFKDYGKAKIYCPSLAEQKRVANVLDKLESKLFVEQELLASFNQQKLYLLGKMFI